MAKDPQLFVPPKGHFVLAGRVFPRVKWWKSSTMRWLYFYIFALICTNTANGYDNSMMNGLQSLPLWQTYFNHPRGSILGLFNCVMSAGALAGLLFVPFMLDGLGRRTTLTIGASIMLVGVALQSAAQSFGMFVGARFILGFGDIIVNCASPLLIAEIAPAQDRALLVTIQAANYQSGAFIAAWVTYGTLKINSNWAWRAPSLIQGVFTVWMLAVVWFMPESPRYYINKDKSEKAMQVLAKYHADGNEHDEVVQIEYTEISTALALEKQQKKTSSFLDFFKTKGNRRRLIILISVGLFSQWSGNGLISYYLNLVLDNIGITDPNQQLLINGGITTFSLVTNVGFSFFVDKWGRRPIYLISTVGSLVSWVIWTILAERYTATKQLAYGKGNLAFIFIYTLFYNFKSGLIASYTTEILPYNLRAKGFTIMEYALYGALFFNQYVNPIAMNALGWKYYIVYCVFLLFEVFVIYFFYAETKYLPLEEITKIFDGEDVAAKTNENLGGEKVINTAVHVEEISAMSKA
ncbi:uncharacterized protein A1O5_07707 [Cladophialophora psammophila CBS 110553]|uniref:Major facilitator superfamily (MFS) profile domain-containing protein n=1 Tax=Cladophialophora psammophila CBS 110553 TaxID=1182543 RepID=W9WVU5_9EURO|nr:uncharacterized protein A1O5_07707 [Cladophialophora psammophila CBS 110553]EXJ68776.1 hypothetical protein A1O5_07707 [Cladophialophora psammophila CBS 110553]